MRTVEQIEENGAKLPQCFGASTLTPFIDNRIS